MFSNFTFHMRTKVIFGKDTIPHIANEIPQNAKIMITYGSGSVIDGTKFISNAVKYNGNNPWEVLLTHGNCCTDGIPVGVVLTLPATGSEMNAGAVITKYNTQDKLDFNSEYSRPVFAIYRISLMNMAKTSDKEKAIELLESALTYPYNFGELNKCHMGLTDLIKRVN